jgi:hypothetical protein
MMERVIDIGPGSLDIWSSLGLEGICIDLCWGSAELGLLGDMKVGIDVRELDGWCGRGVRIMGTAYMGGTRALVCVFSICTCILHFTSSTGVLKSRQN